MIDIHTRVAYIRVDVNMASRYKLWTRDIRINRRVLGRTNFLLEIEHQRYKNHIHYHICSIVMPTSCKFQSSIFHLTTNVVEWVLRFNNQQYPMILNCINHATRAHLENMVWWEEIVLLGWHKILCLLDLKYSDWWSTEHVTNLMAMEYITILMMKDHTMVAILTIILHIVYNIMAMMHKT